MTPNQILSDPRTGNAMLAFLIVINIIWHYNIESATIGWLIYLSPLIVISLIVYIVITVIQNINYGTLGPYWKK